MESWQRSGNTVASPSGLLASGGWARLSRPMTKFGDAVRQRPRGSARVGVVLGLALAGLAGGLGCSGSDRSADSPESGLPPWEGQMQELFDDAIDPAAVGLSMDGRSPARDPLLRPRAQQSDVVAHMRVQTVTRDSVGAKTTYLLTLQVGMPTLMPAKLDNGTFELSINQSASSFGIVQQLDTGLRGLTFIGFVRKFQGDDGPAIHWHLTTDSQEVAQVIQEIAVLDEVVGKEEE
jgi:hypothetical protein